MINKIGIIGCGKMGIDIFNYLTKFPFKITLVCISSEEADKFYNSWFKKQKRSLKYGLLDENTYAKNLARTSCSSDIKALMDADLIIECIFEDQVLKSELFKKLDKITSNHTLFASNTSSIPLSTLIPSQKRSDKFLGLHFFYPVLLKNIVEDNKTKNTSQETIGTTSNFLDRINKYHILLNEENNFLLNKLFLKLQAGVYNLHIQENIPLDVLDDLIKKILFPIGVFEMMDQVGIDVMYTSVLNYTQKLENKKFYQSWLSALKDLVDNGNLRLKSGKGFYDYSAPSSDHSKLTIQNLSESKKNYISEKLFNYYLEPIFATVNSGLCTKEQIEHILKEYIDCYQSPFDLAKEIGYQEY